MKLFILVVIAMCAAANALTQVEIDQQWTEYKVKFNKNYDEKEEQLRKPIFTENLKFITEHNKKYEQGLVTFSVGINQFSDMTEEEKRPYTHGVIHPAKN